MTFGMSAVYTDVAGSPSAVAMGVVPTDSFGTFVSVLLLVGVLAGGLGTIWGALVGAAFIQFVPRNWPIPSPNRHQRLSLQRPC
ncbi:ABC-type branched-subunit amino acid transport system permease subunit [Variovorax sp. OAS795]|uniref:hypothetical protein n=1 Tax=Variovorax sp. OAS795 TaxID=3034231 RepID=UPI0033958DA3